MASSVEQSPWIVLMVDDDRVDRISLRETLGPRVTFHEAADGKTAREIVQKIRPDCVLLDYMIPGTDSLELLAEFSAANIPVVMLTGEGNEDIAVAAMKAGAIDYVRKRDLTQDAIVRTIWNAVQHGALERELSAHRLQLAEANDRLSSQVTELEQLNSDLEGFVHIAAHDFREPLKIIFNYCDLLQTDLGSRLPAECGMYLDSMRRSVRRLSSIIDDLRSLTKIGGAKPPMEPVALDSIVDEVLEDLGQECTAKQVKILRDPLPTVPCTRALVTELYRNLIMNALRYGSAESPWIRVGMDGVTDGHETFVVTNNGAYLDAEDCKQVFQAFFRPRARPGQQGMGLGLLICKRVIDRHGGTIGLSVPRPGEVECRFTLGGPKNGVPVV